MSEVPKKRGRPPMPRRTNGNFTFRTPIGLRERMEVAAAASGRSVSEEVTARLERSFLLDDMRRVIREELAHRTDSDDIIRKMGWLEHRDAVRAAPGVYGPDQFIRKFTFTDGAT